MSGVSPVIVGDSGGMWLCGEILYVGLLHNPMGEGIGEIGDVDPIIIRLEQLRIGRRGGQVESELALIGGAISDLQPERQLIGGEQAARMFGRVLEPCAGDRVREGRRVGGEGWGAGAGDRKSTRLNSSH